MARSYGSSDLRMGYAAVEALLIGMGFVKEYQFAATRRWRFDYAHLEHKVAVEVEGGVFTKGRHVRPLGYLQDMGKYNEAAILGWKVLRYDTKSFAQGQVLRDLERLGFYV